MKVYIVLKLYEQDHIIACYSDKERAEHLKAILERESESNFEVREVTVL